MVKNLPARAGGVRHRVQSLGREDSLEEDMAAGSSVPAWRTPRTEEPGGLPAMGLLRVACDLATEQQQFFKDIMLLHT